MLFCDVGVTVQSQAGRSSLTWGQGGWTFSDPNFPPRVGSQGEAEAGGSVFQQEIAGTRPPPPSTPYPAEGLVVPGGAPMGTGVCPTLCQEKSAGLPPGPSITQVFVSWTWM